MNKGILERLNENMEKFNENIEKLFTSLESTAQAQKEEPVKEEAPKKTTKKAPTKKAEELKQDEVKEEPKEVEVKEEPVKEEAKAEEETAETVISDDDLKKVVFAAKNRDTANLAKAKDYLKERNLVKITELEQSERQAFIDYMESL